MTVLQTIALPLGYSAIRMARGRVSKADGGVCQYLDLISAGSRLEERPWDSVVGFQPKLVRQNLTGCINKPIVVGKFFEAFGFSGPNC